MVSPTPLQSQTWIADTAEAQENLIRTADNQKCGDSSHGDKTLLKPLEIRAAEPKRRPRRRYIKITLAWLILILVATPWIKMSAHLSHGEDEPNPPPLPDSIVMFYPPMNKYEIEQMQAVLDRYSDPIIAWEDFSRSSSITEEYHHPDFTYTSSNHFTSKRTALVFTPGMYPVDIQVGYYTSIYGLGSHPDNVTFTGDKGPHCPALDKFTDRPPHGSGLNSFWRCVENIATKPKSGGMIWAVSQAAPLRRMKIYGHLNLFDGDSWVSGGFGSNLEVHGEIHFGGQQQWIMRNVQTKDVSGGAWNLVFVGCTGKVPHETMGSDVHGPSISVEKEPRIRQEKPYIALRQESSKQNGQTSKEFELRVPKATIHQDVIGPQFDERHEETRDFRRVKLAIPSKNRDAVAAAKDNHSTIQRALDQGKDVVLSPGIYELSSSLEVKHPNQIILGLGYATLVAPTNGSPCIHVRSMVPGVKIAGIMLEASALTEEGQAEKSCLLQWGEEEVPDDGDGKNPGLLSDVFARVGGSSLRRDVTTSVMVRLYSGNIVGDNIWLWRADHVVLYPGEKANFPEISNLYRQTELGECQVKNGLIVNGSNITIFGLAVEHTTEDQVIWSGENGAVYFYQSELPYDVDQLYAKNKFTGYRVNPNVSSHFAHGVGVYSNFRDYDVSVDTAVILPDTGEVKMKNIFTVKLDNIGKISSIVNGRGPGPTPETERGVPLRCLNSSCV